MTFLNVVIWLRHYCVCCGHRYRSLQRGGGAALRIVADCRERGAKLIFIWSNHCRYTLRQLRTPGQRFRSAAVVVLAGVMVWAPIRLLDIQQKG